MVLSYILKLFYLFIYIIIHLNVLNFNMLKEILIVKSELIS